MSRHKLPCAQCAQHKLDYERLKDLLKAVNGMLSVLLAENEEDASKTEAELMKLLEKLGNP